MFATELPLQMLAGQFALLAAVTRKLSPRLRRFSWLVSALSWLGLLGLHRLGTRANVPLTAALDAGLGTDRRTESGDLWKRPAGAGTAKPGVGACCGSTRLRARHRHQLWRARRPQPPRHLATARPGPGGRAPVLLQVPAVPGWWEETPAGVSVDESPR